MRLAIKPTSETEREMYNELTLTEISAAAVRASKAAHMLARVSGPADWLAHEAAWAQSKATSRAANIQGCIGFLRHPVVHNPGAGHPSYGRGVILARPDGTEYSVNWDR